MNGTSSHFVANVTGPESAPRIVLQSVEDPLAQREQLRAGLFEREAHIEPKFFYDAQGCALFSALCALDEYYPTRTEQAIFERRRGEIADCLPRGAQWVDLGCGDGVKARPWLAAAGACRYIGVDIAQDWLRDTLASMGQIFPQLQCTGVVADFSAGLDVRGVLGEFPQYPSVFFYPGSSIGNFARPVAVRLLSSIRAHLDHQGALLIGIDLVKDPRRLEAAYDDALGVTAAFNRNVLRVANRLIDAEFDPRDFDHLATFNPHAARIEMRLRARRALEVRIGSAVRAFAAGETILTEYSQKYTHDSFGAMLNEAGFRRHRFWTDESQDFGVFVAAP